MTRIEISAGATRRATDLARELIDACTDGDPSATLTRIFNEMHDDLELSAATLYACANIANAMAHAAVLAQLGHHDETAVALALDTIAGRQVTPRLRLVVDDD